MDIPINHLPVQKKVRRKFSKARKRQIVEECFGDDSTSIVARRHDINANLLFKWRKDYESKAVHNQPSKLLPIQVDESQSPVSSSICLAIDLGRGCKITVYDNASTALLRESLLVLNK